MPLSSFFGGLQRFAGQALGGAQRAYGQADRALGGWLPGGGTASPAARASQALGRALSGENIREKVVVPAIDAALKAGAPATPGMFARYLTGTSTPMTFLPPAVKGSVQELVSTYGTDTGDPKYDEQRYPITWREAYGHHYNPSEAWRQQGKESNLTLGQFTVDPKTKEVIDRYDFSKLAEGKNAEGLYQDAREGGPMASFALDFALKSGLIKPSSGYPIKASYQ